MKIIALTCGIVLMCATTVSAQQFSSFQNGGALGSDSWSIPKEWSPEAGIKWQAKLAGYGQSSAVLHGDVAYVTTVTGPKKETINIEAFAIEDGSRKWIHSQSNSTLQDNNVMISRAAPTPVADDNGLIAMFEGGNVIAMDHQGKVRWEVDLAKQYGDVKARHGLASSLEHDKDHVFIWVERMEKPYVLALKKSDGSVVWKIDGVGSTAWASPRLIDVGDAKHLVLSAIGKIVGLDPASGNRLWSFDDIQGNSSATPMPAGEGRFLIGSGGSRGGPATKPCCGVIKIDMVDGKWAANWDWSSKKVTCSFGSPIAFDGKAYFVNRTGIVNCHDLETGDKVFAGRLPGGQIWATPLAANGLLYFFGKGGVTSIIESGRELNVVSDNRLWEPEPEPKPDADNKEPQSRFSGSVLYSASVAGDQLLLRRGDVLYSVAGLGKK